MHYHVNAETGDDRNDGRTEETAIRTLAEACRRVEPGDTLFLRGIFHEPLMPEISGQMRRPIHVCGPAVIDTLGHCYAAQFRELRHWSLRDIHFRVMGPEVPEWRIEQPLGVIILRQASHMRFHRCTFIGAGLGTERAPVEIIQSAFSHFTHCTAICPSRDGRMFGKRAWLISGSMQIELDDCSNYGGSELGPNGSLTRGAGVGVTIYGAKLDGIALPCIGNIVRRHRSFNTMMYAYGLASGPTFCANNVFERCVAYMRPGGYAGLLTALSGTASSRSGAMSHNNEFRHCTVLGRTRYGLRVRGLQARAVECVMPEAEIAEVTI